jgi:hypothetical protein
MSQGARKISEGHRWLLSSAACARNELRLVVLRVKRWRPVSVNMEQGYIYIFCIMRWIAISSSEKGSCSQYGASISLLNPFPPLKQKGA